MHNDLLWNLQSDIEAAARRKIRAFERQATNLRDENQRRQRRSTGTVAQVRIREPDLWQYDGHNPRRVLRKARSISHAISSAIKSGTYAPLPPRGFSIPKSDGSSRQIGVFALADEVISRRVYRTLMRKNLPLLSARSYAYRSDRGVYDAIRYIDSEWRSAHRLFVAEYDFTRYFDELAHDHIWTTLDELRFSVTPVERRILQAVLRAPLPLSSGANSAPAELRSKGVPLGTSVSLFLANVAAAPLDRELERHGVNFSRFADDVLIWSRDYAAMCAASDAMHDFSKTSGTTINSVKSEGIRLLIPAGHKSEMRSTESVSYLSHKMALGRIGMKESALVQLKKIVNQMTYDHLLREPLAGRQVRGRLTGNDRDYVALVWQLRRLIYGSMPEEQVRRLSEGQSFARVPFTGYLSHYALTNDWEALARLDGEIVTRVWLALRKRESLLRKKFPGLGAVVPWGVARTDLPTLKSSSGRSGSPLDLRIPSAVAYVRGAQNAVSIYGTSVLGKSATFYGEG